ncbi:hypothetical protein GJ496_001858 [Pomphorhynchus laevis]|nr:hypothetical protein GJ496_001858 [Pomphorhynchus laevis]
MHLLLVNRYSFAQASDLTRYLYSATLSHSSSIPNLLKKLQPLRPCSVVEVIYVCNMIKTDTALDKLKRAGFTKWMSEGVNFAMPQDRSASKEFSYYASSMFVSRLYNKVKAFSEPA